MSEQIPVPTEPVEETETETELDTTENTEGQDNKNQEADRSREMADKLREFFQAGKPHKDLMDIDNHRKALVEIMGEGTGSESEKDLMNLMNNIKETLDEIKSNRKEGDGFSRDFSDIVKGNFEEDAHGLSADMRQNTREYISSLLIYAENQESSITPARKRGTQEEKDQIIQIEELSNELNDFLDDQITKINNTKDINELRAVWNNPYLSEIARKSADLGMPVYTGDSLRELQYVISALHQHVKKGRPFRPFSAIKKRAEVYIDDLPKANKYKAREYVDALMRKVEEITGEYKEE